MTTYSKNWKTDAHAINGMEDSHYALGQYVESKGFEVMADHENNERSYVLVPGDGDFAERCIGEINGDSEAKIVITADLSN